MDLDERLMQRLRQVDCLGIMLWGSHAQGTADARSDIDVCIVSGPDKDPGAVLSDAWRQTGRFPDVDVKVFEDLPIYLQGQVFGAHQVLVSEDEPALYEYLRPYWKRWRDQAHRQRLTAAEARALLRRRPASQA